MRYGIVLLCSACPVVESSEDEFLFKDSPMDLDEVTSLGFSASDVLDTVGAQTDYDATPEDFGEAAAAATSLVAHGPFTLTVDRTHAAAFVRTFADLSSPRVHLRIPGRIDSGDAAIQLDGTLELDASGSDPAMISWRGFAEPAVVAGDLPSWARDAAKEVFDRSACASEDGLTWVDGDLELAPNGPIAGPHLDLTTTFSEPGRCQESLLLCSAALLRE